MSATTPSPPLFSYPDLGPPLDHTQFCPYTNQAYNNPGCTCSSQHKIDYNDSYSKKTLECKDNNVCALVYTTSHDATDIWVGAGSLLCVPESFTLTAPSPGSMYSNRCPDQFDEHKNNDGTLTCKMPTTPKPYDWEQYKDPYNPCGEGYECDGWCQDEQPNKLCQNGTHCCPKHKQ